MIGVTDYGVYVPRLRLARAAIKAAWGTGQIAGERSVANYDEDALTLAAEAASSALASGGTPDALLFASTSAPYAEKQVAAFLATVCDLPRGTWTADFAGSSRAGLSAMVAGWHAVAAGSSRDLLVTAADVRVGEPEGELEGWFGDAGAAVRIGGGEVIAEIVGAASVSEEFTHYWRTDDSRFVRVYSGKFSDTYGYVRDLGEAIRRLLERQGLAADKVARFAVATPGARSGNDLAKAVGFDAKSQLVVPPFTEIGSAGVADPLLALIKALETSRPGDLIVVGSYGEGADAILLRVVTEPRPGKRLADHLAAKLQLGSYEKYLKYRRLIAIDEPGEVVTNVLEYNELRQDTRLYGSRCRRCETVQYPMARVCVACKAREQLDEHKLARRGTIFTFTIDHLIPSVELPLPMVVVDLAAGGRVYVQATDFVEDEIQVGRPVELTFRRLHEGGGNHNYYWKARPPR